MDARKLIGRNVRRLRVTRALSQEALATDAGVERSYVSALERGKKNPTLLVLDRLTKALGVALAELFQLPGRASHRRRLCGQGGAQHANFS